LSLDEFPQFINVLQGSMSIVGPRPHLGLHDTNFAKVAPAHRMRSLIKPGVTGLAQVTGFRGPTSTVGDVLGRTRSDLYYLENWSLKLDLMIISRTLLQFFRQCGS
jgi:lipopolysaccharide/colanic/teichoic acid biosynthesis glycosyltransferase